MHRCYYIGLPIVFIISMISEDMAIEFKGIVRKFKNFKRAIVVMSCMFNLENCIIKRAATFSSLLPGGKTVVRGMSPLLPS